MTTPENHSLSNREREILELLAKGKSNGDISAILNIRERTVKFHINSIMRKLNAHNRTHAVVIAMQGGIICIK